MGGEGGDIPTTTTSVSNVMSNVPKQRIKRSNYDIQVVKIHNFRFLGLILIHPIRNGQLHSIIPEKETRKRKKRKKRFDRK